MGKILDGKKISAEVYEDLRNRCAALQKKGVTPGLATVLVGDDPASHVYVGQKIKKCEETGIKSYHRPLPATVSQADLIKTIASLNADPGVHGIIVQLPLPSHLDPDQALEAISNNKDADGLHPLNQGYLARMKSWKDIENEGIPIPCTPHGVIHMLLREKIEISGKHVVVVGRSVLVGKPLAQLFLSLDATVTMAHSRTKNLPAVCRQADILVAAIGKQEFIRKDAVKEGAVVVDVGISRTDKGLKGDVDFRDVEPHASWITPVPGGVGVMTVAMLLKNTVVAAEKTAK
jgi:methylenetetrahydrofolate dehydrogenase (NADP+)/methenyltetrahydrofolate cyclohydrolase